MGADIEVGHREEGCQPPPYKHTVRVTLSPYSYARASALLRDINYDFPKKYDNGRWYYKVITESIRDSQSAILSNDWILDFYFRDIEDAVMFGLKYSS